MDNMSKDIKEGNIYYKPVYDKGYNFSRRYLPTKYRFI